MKDAGRWNWIKQLSPKELEVLEAYSVHHSYEAVARALGKSFSVVDQQLLSARRKMGAASTAHALLLLAEYKAATSSGSCPLM